MTYSMLTEHQTAKLPQWAQRHIAHLERQIDEADKRIELFQHGAEDTDTTAEIYSDQPFRLPRGTRVRFQLGPEYDEYIDARITERRPGQRVIELHGGSLLIIRPLSGNLASAELDSR